MQITYEFTPKDMQALEVFLIKKHAALMIFGVFCIAMLLLSAVSNLSKHHYLATYWGLFLIAVVAIFAYSRIARNRKLKLYGLWTLSLNDDGIRVAPPDRNEAFIPWQNLHSTHQSKGYVFILTNAASGIAIAQKRLAPEDGTALMECLHNHASLIGSRLPTKRAKRGYPLFPIVFMGVLIAFVLMTRLVGL